MNDAPPHRRILVVDDTPANLTLLRVTLELQGYAILEAADGVEALRRLEREPADAIVSDVMMPNMDGYRLCSAVRADPRWRGLPFVFCSGMFDSPADLALADAAGADRFVASHRPEELIKTLDELLAAPRTRADAATAPLSEPELMLEFNARLVAKLEQQLAEARQHNVQLQTEVARRERAEAGIMEREQQLRLFVEHSPAAIAMLDREMRYVLVSRRWLSDYGKGDQDLRGRSLYDVCADPPERWKDVHRRCLAGAVERCEADEIRQADGSIGWVRWEVRPWHTAQDAIGGLIVFTEDITERKQAQDALALSIAQLDAAQERAHLGSWELDLATGAGYWSREMFRLFGCDPALGVPPVADFPQLVHPEDRHQFERLPERLADAAGPLSIEYRTNPARGPVRYLNATLHAITGPEGRLARMAGTVLDVTDRRRDAHALQRALRHARLLARRVTEVRETEQRQISAELHDRIGQNLTALGINLSLVGSQLPPDTAPPALSRLEDSRALLDTTISSVRDLMQDLRPIGLDEHGLALALRWYAGQFQSRTGIQTSVRAFESLARLPAPVEIALFRIAQEAFNNVAHHSQAHNVTVALVFEGADVVLSVSDDGRGFDVDAMDAGEVPGHWGLAIMRERAEAVGSALHVESAKGRGTTIRVRAPRGMA